MHRLFLVVPLAGLSWLPLLAPPADRDVHEAMEEMEAHLEALSDASLSALLADPGSDTSAFATAAQTALDGLAAALHPILLSTPDAPAPTEGETAPTAAELHRRELAYQRLLVQNLDQVLATEEALARGDWEAVQSGVDLLYEQEESGHDAFRVKRKRKRNG